MDKLEGETRKDNHRKPMIGFGCDHAGLVLKDVIFSVISDVGYKVKDFGTNSSSCVDYPCFGLKVAKAVKSNECELGILVCGTGVGMSITANKIPGVRAALCSDCYTARMSRAHNDANILTLGARVTGSDLAKEIVKTFIETDFLGGRHQRRLQLITEAEKGSLC